MFRYIGCSSILGVCSTTIEYFSIRETRPILLHEFELDQKVHDEDFDEEAEQEIDTLGEETTHVGSDSETQEYGQILSWNRTDNWK